MALVGVVVEVPRSSPVCGDLWEPVPARRCRANVVAAALGSRDLVGRSGTTVSSPPPSSLPSLQTSFAARASCTGLGCCDCWPWCWQEGS